MAIKQGTTATAVKQVLDGFQKLSDEDCCTEFGCKKMVEAHTPHGLTRSIVDDMEQVPKLKEDVCYHLRCALATLEAHKK